MIKSAVMKTSIQQIVRSHPLYFLASLAFFISTVGTAFTSVAVYFLLEQYQAHAMVFAVVFAAGTLPGFLTSLWAGNVVHRKNLFFSVLGCQIIATIALAVPLIGMTLKRVELFVVAEIIASATTGILLPFIKRLEKLSFQDKHLEFIAAYDTYFFTFSFIFGQGMATILLGFMSTKLFLLIDFFTYLVSCAFLISLRESFQKIHMNTLSSEAQYDANCYRTLGANQRRVLLTFIWLSLTCSAPMALLPAMGQRFSVSTMLALSPTLVLLCSRTVGQILAPIIATFLGIAQMATSKALLVAMLCAYLFCYAGAFSSHNLWLSCAMVIVAHFFSNIVFTIAQYQLLKEFNAHIIGWAAAFNYRAMIISSVSISLLAGFWIDHLSLPSLFILLFFIMVVGFVSINWPLRFLKKTGRFYSE